MTTLPSAFPVSKYEIASRISLNPYVPSLIVAFRGLARKPVPGA